ncbi:MAG: sulfate ABC transporter permease subunit CysW [Actinobacteria bacterium]|nr:sulfate ABC transporter permease subunit CysW [Actinomycetota bacterium]
MMDERRIVRILLTTLALGFLGLFLVVPLVLVFAQAFSAGLGAYVAAIAQPDALSAIRLSLIVALITVPLNTIFGLAAGWSIGKFDFRGKGLLVTLIELPVAVSPVVSGLVFVLLFGAQGLAGGWLAARGIEVIFAVPGIVLATTFVTFPYVARELIAFMQSQGNEAEEAALVLGAGGVQTFLRVTLPNIKWSLLYGVIQANARTLGEFGAVSVVSGHIRGETNTIPLHVEILYNEYSFAAAFSVASLLVVVALLTLAAKRAVGWRAARRRAAAERAAIHRETGWADRPSARTSSLPGGRPAAKVTTVEV